MVIAADPAASPPGEREVEALVAGALAEPSRRDELVAALREDAPHHAQKSRAATARMRGWLLAAFERTGLPDAAVPHVVEELESGLEAYLVAAAARAVRGRTPPEPAFAPYLVRALANVRGRDEPLTFEAYGAYARGGAKTTAVREILVTLRWMGPAARAGREQLARVIAEGRLLRADREEAERCLRGLEGGEGPVDCCTLPLFGAGEAAPGPPGEEVRVLRFEDQRGVEAGFDEVFGGGPTIVVFFYTRCDNPQKCSLAVSRLAGVQAALAREGLLDAVGTAAITYDPAYDRAPRLRAYGEARGWIEHPKHRLLRAVAGQEALVRHLRLGVGFVASIVNRHRTECLVVDGEGRVRRSFPRNRWEEGEVIAAAREALPGGSRAGVARSLAALLPSVLVAFFPKCALCWAAYLSLLGVTGVSRIPYAPWLVVPFAALMLLNLGSLGLRARHSGSWLGFALSAAGAGALLLGAPGVEVLRAPWVGIALVGLGSLLGTRTALTR